MAMNKRIKHIYMLLCLTLGLGYNIFILFFFWKAYLMGIYSWEITINNFNEFWLEFIYFNITTLLISIAIIYQIKKVSDPPS